ncbi:uncharacterized protein J8A68_001492 [[Candida] subhashii]|uniref:Uncharacterized protein n=1 Tax=[Candida] subhashii TaxID=561895 RepID=A0A8J5QG12_9ASCO|nr:uncharacterized protein J8A68_001492 [[Candida] subhashii]KAG7664964.1 hypothetical protein J8A68_001492 [[Candida] subhashii]
MFNNRRSMGEGNNQQTSTIELQLQEIQQLINDTNYLINKNSQHLHDLLNRQISTVEKEDTFNEIQEKLSYLLNEFKGVSSINNNLIDVKEDLKNNIRLPQLSNYFNEIINSTIDLQQDIPSINKEYSLQLKNTINSFNNL